MNFNSRESNFYDSHAQREMTLAWSEKYRTMVAVGDERGTDTLTHFFSRSARADFGGDGSTDAGLATCSGAKLTNTWRESDATRPRDLGPTSASSVSAIGQRMVRITTARKGEK